MSHPTVEMFLAHLRLHGKSEHTIAAYARGLAHFAR